MFDILYNDLVVGNAEILEEGLYYKIYCSCKLPEDGVFRIVMADENMARDLGVCVPVADNFVVNTRIPRKHITAENLRFNLVFNENKGHKMETSQLAQLESARLQIANGQWEIVIDPIPDQPDNGQSQECPHRSELQ